MYTEALLWAFFLGFDVQWWHDVGESRAMVCLCAGLDAPRGHAVACLPLLSLLQILGRSSEVESSFGRFTVGLESLTVSRSWSSSWRAFDQVYVFYCRRLLL